MFIHSSGRDRIVEHQINEAVFTGAGMLGNIP